MVMSRNLQWSRFTHVFPCLFLKKEKKRKKRKRISFFHRMSRLESDRSHSCSVKVFWEVNYVNLFPRNEMCCCLIFSPNAIFKWWWWWCSCFSRDYCFYVNMSPSYVTQSISPSFTFQQSCRFLFRKVKASECCTLPWSIPLNSCCMILCTFHPAVAPCFVNYSWLVRAAPRPFSLYDLVLLAWIDSVSVLQVNVFMDKINKIKFKKKI
jgi:hypothetical protein